jgi:uncharacterized BrkB/YihY/UPF0761 family membrane protein
MSKWQRWKRSSWPAKAVAVLAVLLILQVGLCFGAPISAAGFDALFHLKPVYSPLEWLGMMTILAVTSLVSAIALLVAGIVLAIRRAPPNETRKDPQ